MSRVAIVIVNYNGSHDTCECLGSLVPQLTDRDAVYVVDNGSRADDATQLGRCVESLNDTRVKVVASHENTGFAGGNNLGIQAAGAEGFEFLLLLNNDTVVESGALDALVSGAFSTAADLAGPKILYYDDPSRVWHGAGVYSPLRQGPVVRDHDRPDDGRSEPRQAGFLTGCALLISKRAFEILGRLDEDYFFIYEDWDYCYRAGQEGLRLVYMPSARVRHKVSRSSGGWLTPFSLYHQARGRLLFIQKHSRGLRRYAALAYLLTGVTFLKTTQVLRSGEDVSSRLVAWWRGCLGLSRAPSRGPTAS